MADRGTLEAIDKLRAARPRQLLDIIDAIVCTQQNFTTTREGLVAGLRFLVEDFRRQADLVMDSGARGRGAEATALRSTASSLSLLADAVEKVTLDGTGEVLPQVSRGGPSVPAEWCRKTEEHGPHFWELPLPPGGNPLERGPLRRECTGHHERDLTGLKALVAERSGIYGVGSDGTTIVTLHEGQDGSLVSDPVPAQRVSGVQIVGPITLEPGLQSVKLDPPIMVEAGPAALAFQSADPAGTFTSAVAGAMVAEVEQAKAAVRRDGELEAYLSGATNVMPPIRNDREDEPTPSVAAAALQLTEAQSEAFVTPRVNTPDQREAAAAMFADPKPLPGAAPPMPGRVLSWADVRKAPTLAPPEHLSFSQGGTLDECGMQYRLDRLEPDVVGRPHWANVGGTALHAAVEWFETQVAKAPGDGEYAKARIGIAGGFAAIWAKHFAEALTAQVLKTPAVPPASWKAGGRGQSEGWTWWQVEGEEMLRRYLEPRLADMGRTIAGTLGGAPMVELEGVLDVEGVDYKVVIDQVWRGEHFGLEPDSLVIDDLKSSAYAPKGSYQLGGYAWFLRRTGYTASKIYGRFWDARTGKYSDPVDLLELHPWDEVVVRVHGQAAKKAGGIFTPAPDWSRCGGCAVKHACPAALTRG
jgi:hypothetical protein